MAIFHMQIKPVTRSTGRTATSAAAYRAGESIRDERTGALHNHSGREDVLHKEIFLPSRLEREGAAMEWARDRSTLWNTAEKAERRSNSRVAREYMVALPPELSAEQRTALARTFSKEIADRYNVAVDLAIHAPRPRGDPRNFPAHRLATTREVTPEGLGPKTGVDMSGETRSELGLPPSRQEFVTLRARWAELGNDALREANSEARIDHRTLEAQGIDREPTPRLPWGALKAERKGERSEVAERIRERQRERSAARRERMQQKALEKIPDEAAGKTAGKVPDRVLERAPERAQAPQESAPAQGMEARRQQAVRDWLAYRDRQAQAGRGQGEEGSRPLTMDEIRQRAVAAWRSLRARGAESQPSGESRRERGMARGGAQGIGQERDVPGSDEEFSH
ncbi:MAG: MobQ family relaxase [Steroidobacteraceae bacterium]